MPLEPDIAEAKGRVVLKLVEALRAMDKLEMEVADRDYRVLTMAEIKDYNKAIRATITAVSCMQLERNRNG